jgi:hypothetical protein
MDFLVGEVLTYIDIADDEIMLTTESGRKFKIYHYQDCCESVYIEGTDGDFRELIGKPIIEATHEAESGDSDYGSCTKTKLTFKVNDATVISRWIGESNGYYSEGVSIEEITKRV